MVEPTRSIGSVAWISYFVVFVYVPLPFIGHQSFPTVTYILMLSLNNWGESARERGQRSNNRSMWYSGNVGGVYECESVRGYEKWYSGNVGDVYAV